LTIPQKKKIIIIIIIIKIIINKIKIKIKNIIKYICIIYENWNWNSMFWQYKLIKKLYKVKKYKVLILKSFFFFFFFFFNKN